MAVTDTAGSSTLAPGQRRQQGNVLPPNASKSIPPRRAIIDRRAATDFNRSWVNEQDMLVFERALADDPDTTSPIERIRAVNDFAPIHPRIRRKDVARAGFTYSLSRYPLLVFIFSIILFEFFSYVLIRQIVNILEYFASWNGVRGQLRRELRESRSYEEWMDRALALDDYLGFEAWKRSSHNSYYDSSLIRRVLRSLRDLREAHDVEGVRAVLEVAVKANFAGVESFRLYSETFYGSKDLVEDYVDEIAECIAFIRTASIDSISLEEKARFLRHISKGLGCTALLLSGGASFGYYHFGVVRALLDQGLLPRVMSGTSAGAIIAAFACTRTDDELKEMLIPELADKITACSESTLEWMRRAARTGARFDTVEWARKACFFTLGSTTFLEAFQRTGRVLNVSVIPYDTHSPTKLLNYLTAPHCVIYSAVIASAAVPGILSPSVLLEKKNGIVRSWEFQGKHRDGSLRVDIPLDSLNLLFNVSFSIVSQVNPHVHLFHYGARGSPGRPVSHRRGKGWRGGFLLSACEQLLKLELTKNFRIIRDLELMPQFLGQDWSGLFLQRFEGTVTIYPRSRLRDWFRILTDPDREELSRMIRVGQLTTWPKLHMISNRMKIERELELARSEVNSQLTARGLIRRSSSYDTPVRDDEYEYEGDGDDEPTVDHPSSSEDDRSDNDEQVGDDADATITLSRRSSVPSGARTPIEQRREEILSRLGLKSSASSPAGIRLGTDDDSDTHLGGSGSTNETRLQRRRSLGTLLVAERVRGGSESVLGEMVARDDDDEGESSEDPNSWRRR